jgi:hypothetical protein
MISGNFRSESHTERHWIGKDHQSMWSVTKAFPLRSCLIDDKRTLLIHESPSPFEGLRALPKTRANTDAPFGK